MQQTRCCPGDCHLRDDWEQELQAEIELFGNDRFKEANAFLRVMDNPSRLKIAMLLLSRDHCVCEINYVLKEPKNMVSYNLGLLKEHKVIDSYYRSKHKFYRLDDDAVNTVRAIKEHLIEK